MLKKIQNFLEKPERVFISLALTVGLIMVFVMPPFMVPDETVHFYRAYQISEGKFLSETVDNRTGGSVRKVHLDRLKDRTVPEEFVMFPSSALYSPAGYIPQAFGIGIGRIVHSSVLSMMIVGRLINLAAYILLIYVAIRVAKYGKWVYATVGLFPIAIQEAASLATDVITIGSAFITVAFLTNLFFQAEKIRRNQLLILIGLAVLAGLTKQTNLVLFAPIVFLPRHLFGTNLKKFTAIAAIGLAGLMAVGFWLLAMKFAGYNADFESTIGLVGVDSAAQVRFIFTHPFSFIVTLFKTYVFGGFNQALVDFYWNSLHGTFSWLTYKLPLTFTMMGYGTLLLVLLGERESRADKQVLTRMAWVYAASFLLSMITIAGALYMVWTPVGEAVVAGIQGRYFIPIIPLLIPVFILLGRWVTVRMKHEHTAGLLVFMVSAINLSAMVLLTYAYFN